MNEWSSLKIETFSTISNTAFAVSTVLTMLYLILLTLFSKIPVLKVPRSPFSFSDSPFFVLKIAAIRLLIGQSRNVFFFHLGFFFGGKRRLHEGYFSPGKIKKNNIFQRQTKITLFCTRCSSIPMMSLNEIILINLFSVW